MYKFSLSIVALSLLFQPLFASASEAVAGEVVKDSLTVSTNTGKLESTQKNALVKRLAVLNASVIESTENQLKQAREKLRTARLGVNSVEDQLKHLDDEQIDIADRLDSLVREKEITAIQLQLAEDELYRKSYEVTDIAKQLESFLQLLYEESRNSDIELLFSANSLTDSSRRADYLVVLQKRADDLYDHLVDTRNSLIEDRLRMRKQADRLIAMESDLDLMKRSLDNQKEAKRTLLSRLHLQKGEYEIELKRAKDRFLAVDSQLRRIESVSSVKMGDSEEGFVWPVPAVAGLNEGFMDPVYQQLFGIPNYGINIRAVHGSPVVAVKDGVVLKAHNGGDSYSYLVLGHRDDVSTVYGHVSGFNVGVGDEVSRGDIVAWSGGTPGAKGSGWMTTGAHLHFEVRKGGVPLDPLNFLP